MNNYENFYVITKNSAQCLDCGQVVTSQHRHDYVTCACGNLSVDGGTDYIRRAYNTANKVKNLSEDRKMTLDELRGKLDSYVNYFSNSDWGSQQVQLVKQCALEWYQVEI